MPREGVILTRIAVDHRVWFTGKCRPNLSLRWLGNELVLLGQVHQQRRIKPVDLGQIFFRITAMISNHSVDFVAGGRDKYHQPAKTISEQGDLSCRPCQLNSGADRVHDIFHARLAIPSYGADDRLSAVSSDG